MNPEITEEIKWNGPTFSYKGYMVTFNLHEKEQVHLVWHNPAIVKIESELLEGDYPNRRMTYLANMKDVKAKKARLERVVKELIDAMDRGER